MRVSGSYTGKLMLLPVATRVKNKLAGPLLYEYSVFSIQYSIFSIQYFNIQTGGDTARYGIW